MTEAIVKCGAWAGLCVLMAAAMLWAAFLAVYAVVGFLVLVGVALPVIAVIQVVRGRK